MLKKTYFWIAIFWTVFITVLSLMSSDDIPKVRIPNIDKLVHFIFYFFFTITWYLSFRQSNSNKFDKRALFISVAVAVFYGVMIEIFQTMYTVNRAGDVKDVIANTVGSLFAAVLIISYYSLRKAK